MGQKELLEHIKIKHYFKGDECPNLENNTHVNFYNYRMAFDRYLMHFETCLHSGATYVCNQCKIMVKTAEKLIEHSNCE